MKVHHEKFGIGEVVNSTEKLDEAGNIISADVMFEHGIEQDLQISVDEEVEEIEEKLVGNQKKIDANKNGKIDAEDFKKLRKEEVAESVVVTSRVTPDSAALRMPAVENVVRDIMSQHRNLRQEAKENEFKSRNK
jgi:hypothetical protein